MAGRKRKIIDYSKTCIKCCLETPITEFHFHPRDGYISMCIPCQAQYDIERRSTVRGALLQLLSNAKKNTTRRVKRGRHECDQEVMSIEEAEQMYNDQKGFCYYWPTKLVSLVPNSAFHVSLERVNAGGYPRINCVLACLEFNSARQWSWPKIEEMMVISSTPHVFNFSKFISDVYYPPKHIPNPKCVNPDHTKSDDSHRRCKQCRAAHQKRLMSIPKLFLEHHVNRMNRRNREKGSNSIILLSQVIQKILEQDGKCYYSNLPMVFSNCSNWQLSSERLDPTKVYTVDNLVFICLEFNSTCNRDVKARKYDGSDIGKSSQWTRVKFEEWYACLQEMRKK